MKAVLYKELARDRKSTATKASSRLLSEELHRLIMSFADRSVRMRDVLEVLHWRGYTLPLILLVLPFCTPLSPPGLSLPFGALVAFIKKPVRPEHQVFRYIANGKSNYFVS